MEILRIKEVAKKTALSPSSIYKQIRLGNFPEGTKITARATGWSSEAVEAWIAIKLDGKVTPTASALGDKESNDSHSQALSHE